MTRRQWIVAAIVAVVVVAAVAVWAATRSGSDDSAGPDTSPTATTSGSPTPSPSASATSSATPSSSGSPGGSASPSVSGSLAPDGKPLVTIATPTAGEHSNIPVHASGTAVAFEGVARFEILKNGKVFTNGPLYADKGAPARGHWETDIELPIGSYTLVVFLESPKNGKRIAQTEVPFFAG